uniref:Transporter n=1 Tax=Magnetococcus massalia (strain MO-1) TaxID=451514 RepID=A0A1S7LEW1_MAGMO|nr:Conserved protein of unknown function. Putative membrane transporter. Containing auxin efflux carrier domain [Candidatus Magnetococcus massalia]
MFAILYALGPIFLLVLLGALLRRIDFPGASFWPMAEKLTYFMLFPSLLISKLAVVSFEQVDVAALAITIVGALLAVTLLLLLMAPAFAHLFGLSGPGFTSLYQGAIRFNTYVALAAAVQLFGDAGSAHAAVTIAIMIPLINVLCITIFALKAAEQRPTLGQTMGQLVTNPLILGCTIGIVLNLTGIGLPYWLTPLFELLGKPALPLGLLAVGVGLKLSVLHHGLWPLLISSGAKFMLLPLSVALLGQALGLTGVGLQVVVLFMAMPTAPSAFILAKQLGGDADLMATLITGHTLLAMLLLPFVMLLVGGL